MGARYGLTLAGGLEEQEEAVVRAWVQTLVDEIQGIIGRTELRRILMIRPGDRVNDWVHAEARPWTRLQALEDAMGNQQGSPGAQGGTNPPPGSRTPWRTWCRRTRWHTLPLNHRVMSRRSRT